MRALIAENDRGLSTRLRGRLAEDTCSVDLAHDGLRAAWRASELCTSVLIHTTGAETTGIEMDAFRGEERGIGDDLATPARGNKVSAPARALPHGRAMPGPAVVAAGLRASPTR